MRGLAAVCVAVVHFELASYLQTSGITRGWYLFVDFFFVLSGFVLTHAYLGRLGKKPELWSFAIRRFGRLWPLHIVLLGLLVALETLRWQAAQHGVLLGQSEPFTGHHSPWSILSNSLLVHSLGMHDSLTWNEPSWSISVECAAYAIFAVVAARISRTAWAAAAIIVFSAGLLFAFSDTMNHMYGLGLLRCLYGFFMGHLASLLFRKVGSATLPWASACEVAAIVGVALFVCSAGKSAAGLAAPLLFAPVVLVFAFQQGVVSRVLQGAVFQTLGRFSYSIYMVHTLVLIAIVYGVRIAERLTTMRFRAVVDGVVGQLTVLSFGPPLVNDLVAACYVLVVVAAAAFTYRYIERPGQDYFNRLATKVRDRQAAGST